MTFSSLRDLANRIRLSTTLIAVAVLVLALFLGSRPSILWLVLPAACIGAFALIQQPRLGLMAVAPAALIIPLEIGTGTEVDLNPVTLLLPAILALWILEMLRRGELRFARSRVNRPLLLFLLSGLLSLVIGLVTWDPGVSRSSNFTLVQLAQWALFALSAVAFWLTGNLVHNVTWLRRLAFPYLALAGALALVRTTPAGAALVAPVTTLGVSLAPFSMLLTAVAGGQLLFNRTLSTGWQVFLAAALVGVGIYVFYWERVVASNWVGVTAVVGTLVWLRWPRLRWPAIALLLVLALSGALSSAVYEFAGGDDEWAESGGSRLALIGRTVEVSMRNPITGLGPAAYRRYAGVEPLFYEGAYWIAPLISSHNNYVDLFAHVGLLGMALFFWFAAEVARLGIRLRSHFTEGFTAGYVNGALAAGAGALTLMLFADWMLPFVYNVGFIGFQASVLVWLFVGGLVALEQIVGQESTC